MEHHKVPGQKDGLAEDMRHPPPMRAGAFCSIIGATG